MSGSFDYSPPPADLTGWATAVLACRYDGEADPKDRYTFLPNVWVEQVQFKDQGHPSTVQFSYILDDNLPYPSQFDQLFPINSPPNPYKVKAGDRIVVLYVDAGGDYRVLWDGFAQLPQADLNPKGQAATFVGAHVSARLWDNVVAGRRQRNGTKPEEAGDPVRTDLPCRFNPDDRGNCTPKDADEEDEESGDTWPVFLEPGLKDAGNKDVATDWDLSKFVRYLLRYYNDETYIFNPPFGPLDDLLSSRKPKNGEWYDPTDPATYTDEPIVVRDFDATNRPPIDVIEMQLAYAGFRLRFITEGTPLYTSDGVTVEEPYNSIDIYRFDAGDSRDPKVVSLQGSGATLDPGQTDVSGLSLQADFHAVANQWSVETKPIRYEVGVLLAPGFTPKAGDDSPSARKQWLASNESSATKEVREKYRLYIGDECGEGHWNLVTKDWREDEELLLAKLFQDDDTNPGGTYVKRYRPGLNSLFSLDPSGKPYKAQLRLSRDYAGVAPPCLWDGSGTWQTIHGGWRLLKDRLGILVDIEDPMAWDIGKPADTPAQEPSGTLDGVGPLANPSTTVQRQKVFYLMLTAVIEGDFQLDATSENRAASPYPFIVSRQVDAKDHFKKSIVDFSSGFYQRSDPRQTGGRTTTQDDSGKAKAYADDMRASREFPVICGHLTIPWFTAAYHVGDRIAGIDGRNLSFATNAGKEQGEKPNFPYVSGITYQFGGGQKTCLQLSDRRSEPAPLARRRAASGR